VRKNPKRGADVYVVHQLTPDGSRYDEDKVMLGYASEAEALRDFRANCFKPKLMVGGVSRFTMEHFKVVAWSASNSRAMLASQAEYDRFKKEGLLPTGIRSPIQVAQKVSESMEDNESPLISYDDMEMSANAFDLAQKNGLEAQRDGYRLYFADPDDLETFIDIVDHHQLPRDLLGDLQSALPETVTVESPTLSTAVTDANTDDVFFQQQIAEMRQLAGVKHSEITPTGTPIVHTTKAIVESIDDGFRKGIKESYVRYARERRVPLMVESEQWDKALRLCALTQQAYPKEHQARIRDAVVEQEFGTLAENANLGRYIEEQTGMDVRDFVQMFAEQEVEEKFNKPAHDWVRKRAAELYPKVVKDKGAAFARAWVEYKQK
jgi:hypothetical protein